MLGLGPSRKYVRFECRWVDKAISVLMSTGWVKSKAYSRVLGGWVGQKCDDFERTYFMDDPFRAVLKVTFANISAEYSCNIKTTEDFALTGLKRTRSRAFFKEI